ncbi:MAG: hypothetical protein CMJ84_09535 [Planctomycetes bacterium]|jgi:hypothetical protein|nr:hypothetical protein [Planctomycetota bacterium]
MRFAVFALTASILFSTALGHAQQLDPWQLVGHTTTTHLSGEGLRAFTLACQAEFGLTARMCTSAEVQSTITWPSLTARSWVQPVILVSGGFLQDAATGGNAGTCDGWSSNNGGGDNLFGFLLTPTGSMGQFENDDLSNTAYCGIQHPVACCRRVPEPTASLMLPVGGLACLGLAKSRS